MARTAAMKFAGLAAAVVTMGAIGCSVAKADVNGYYIGPSDWLFTMSGLSDIDQIRATKVGVTGLPNNGKMYCVPTAAMNLMAYISSHGYGAMLPGNKNWSVSPPNANYNKMSDLLKSMGMSMNTDPINGTGGQGFIDGVNAFLASDPVHKADFTVNLVGAAPAAPINLGDVTKSVLQGSIADLVLGWYKYDDLRSAYVRKGGHAVTLQGASSPGLFSPPNISINDPNFESMVSTYAQSPYSTETYNLGDLAGKFGWVDNNGNYHNFGPLQAIQNYGSGHVDGILTIHPLKGLSTDGIYFNLYNLVQLRSASLLPAVQKFASADGAIITSAAMDPVGATHPYLTAKGDMLFEIDTVTGESRRSAPVSHAKQVIIGGDHRGRFVLTDSRLYNFGVDGQLIGLLDLETPVDTIAMDVKNHRIVGFHSRRKGDMTTQMDLLFFDVETLRQTGGIRFAEDFGALLPAVRVAMDGSVFLHNAGEKFMRKLPLTSMDTVKVIPLVGSRSPQGMTMDDSGRIYFCDGSVMKAFEQDGTAAIGRVPFKGAKASPVFDITRSFNNLDPMMENNPAFYNVLPDVRPR